MIIDMANILSLGNIAVLSYSDRIEIYKYKEDKENEQLNQFLQFLNLLIMTEPYIKYVHVTEYKLFESPDYILEDNKDYWSIKKKDRGSTVLREWGVISLDYDGRVKLINKIKSSFIDE